jgi:hypothetical protein
MEEHTRGMGTPDLGVLEARAKEIALTKGREPGQFTEADLDEARQELTGAPAPDNEILSNEPRPYIPLGVPPGASQGQSAPTTSVPDEQQTTQALVDEGVEEATHDEMMEGNQESRRRDEAFEDQPGSGS